MTASVTDTGLLSERHRADLSGPLAWLAMIIVSALIAGYAIARPGNATDLLFYIGTVHQWEGLPAEANHTATFADARVFLSPEAYSSMISENGYMRTVTADPQAFVQQIPFYSVKVLYPAAMLVLGRLGLGLGWASILIAAFAYAALALLIFAWLRRYVGPWTAWLLATLIALSPPFWTIARLESPDSLAAFLVIAGLFAILEVQKPRLGMAILLVAVLARPNDFVIMVAVGACLALAARSSRPRLSLPEALSWAGLALGLVAFLSIWSGNYGLGTLFYFAVVQYLPYPAAGPPPLPVAEILRLYVYKVATLSVTPIPLFTLLGVLAILIRKQIPRSLRQDPHSLVVVAMFASMAFGFLTYPNEPERILVAEFFYCAIILAASLGLSTLRSSLASGEPLEQPS